MKKLALVSILLLLFASAAHGQSVSLDGVWVNVDPDTRGVTKMVFERTGATDVVHAWGACHPTDCVWGPTALHRLGASINSETLPHGFATWEFGFSTNHLAFEPLEDELVVTVFTLFRDESGRSDMRHQLTFRRGTGEELSAAPNLEDK